VTTDRLIQPFLDAVSQRRLVLPTCPACATIHWYPLPLCPACQGRWSWQEVCPEATLFSWTTVFHAFSPDLAGKLPYLVALVEPVGAPGVHLVTTLLDVTPEELRIGMSVTADFEVPVSGNALMPVFRPSKDRPRD
jgi:uncharacterized protein